MYKVSKVRVVGFDHLGSNPGSSTCCVTLRNLPNFLNFSFLTYKMGTII